MKLAVSNRDREAPESPAPFGDGCCDRWQYPSASRHAATVAA
jgi:hypothetical protein